MYSTIKNCKRIKIQSTITTLECKRFGVSAYFSIYGGYFSTTSNTYDCILEKKETKRRKRG